MGVRLKETAAAFATATKIQFFLWRTRLAWDSTEADAREPSAPRVGNEPLSRSCFVGQNFFDELQAVADVFAFFSGLLNELAFLVSAFPSQIASQ